MRATVLAPRDATSLTATQIRELRQELERERRRHDDADPRNQMFQNALERLDEGTYGTCVKCADNIPYGRLSVMPETSFCVRCGPGR